MAGFVISEQGHVVTMLAPVSASTALTSEVISMENWAHATIILMGGAGSATTMTVSECDDFTPTSAATIAWAYSQEATAAGDTLTALAAAGTAGVSTGTSTGTLLIAEIDAAELTDGMPNLQVNISDPGTSKVVSIIVILSGGRYQEDITATVIV